MALTIKSMNAKFGTQIFGLFQVQEFEGVANLVFKNKDLQPIRGLGANEFNLLAPSLTTSYNCNDGSYTVTIQTQSC